MNTRRAFLLPFVVLAALVAVRWGRQDFLNSQLLRAVSADAGGDAVRDLVRRGADPNASSTSDYDTPLCRAALNAGYGNDSGMVRALLEAGASARPRGGAGVSPAMALASEQVQGTRHADAAEYRLVFAELRSHGADQEERDSLGFTPLMRAVWAGNPAAAQALLELGADPRALDTHGDRVRDWAAFNGPGLQLPLDALLDRALRRTAPHH